MMESSDLIMDIRRCPREAKVAAFAKGLIPDLSGE